MSPKLPSALTSITLALGLLFSAGLADTAKAAAQKSEASKPAAPAAGAPAAAAAPAAEAPVTEDTKVYLAKSGSRYHVKGCKYLKNAGKEVTLITAMKQGYAPCNVCKAPHLKRE